jgi:hypothetical protein
MPNSIDDVRALGYTAELAQGSVEVEEAALEEARANATAETIAVGAETVALDVGRAAVAQGVEGQELADLISQATVRALEALSSAADERVAFHERAVEIAQAMPNVWAITGPGVPNLYVACQPDGTGLDDEQKALLDALCEPAGHKERSFQHHAPEEVVAAVLELRVEGEEVEAQADESSFEVKIGEKRLTTEKAVLDERDARKQRQP